MHISRVKEAFRFLAGFALGAAAACAVTVGVYMARLSTSPSWVSLLLGLIGLGLGGLAGHLVGKESQHRRRARTPSRLRREDDWLQEWLQEPSR